MVSKLRAFLPLLAAAALTGCGPKPVPPVPVEVLAVSDARVTLSPVAGRPAAAYLTITGTAPDRLIALASPKVATIELHEGGMTNGMMTMAKVDGIDLPAGGQAKLAPGGFHAMLFGVDPTLKPGATLPLTLTFESGATLETGAAVRAAGDAEAM